MHRARIAPYLVVTAILAGAAGAVLAASRIMWPTATSHLYVAAGDNGLRVIDVTTPGSPQEVGAAGPQSTTLAVAVQDAFAYTAEGGGGLLVVDVANPSAPLVAGALGGNSSDIAVYGDVAYMVDPAGLRVVSVADRGDPQEIGFVQAGATSVAVEGVNAYVTGALGLTIVNVADPTFPRVVGTLLGRAEDVAVAAGRAYLVGPIGGLRVVDVTDTARPTQLGSAQLAGDLRAVAVAGTRAFVAAQSVSALEPGALYVVDVTDAAAPVVLGAYAGSFRDVAVDGDAAYAVTESGAVEVVDASTPSAPVRAGLFTPSWSALRIAVAAAEPVIPTLTPTTGPTVGPTGTDTPTATSTATISGTVGTPTPTLTASPSATSTATHTRPPTATPTPVTPTITPTDFPTRVPGRSWTQFTTGNAPLPSNDLRFVATDGDGTAWVRAVRGHGRPDGVVGARARAAWWVYGDLRSAVTARGRDIQRLGALDEFWALDRAGNIWIGAEHFDGQSWRIEGVDEWSADGRVQLAQQVVVDSAGYAWVPYGTDTQCRGTAPCRIHGLRAFVAGRRMETDITFESDPSAVQRGASTVMLRSNHLRPAPTGQGWALSQRSLYPLPFTYTVNYPGLPDVASSPRIRSGGYATASTVQRDGRLLVFTWVERHAYDLASRRVVDNRVFESAWDGTNWSTPVDLTVSPLFPAGVADDRVVAAAYGPDGARWTATSNGIVAVQDVRGAWIDAFRRSELGLPAGARIRDLAVGPDGTVWVATSAGLFAYGQVDPARVAWDLFLPSTRKE